MKESLKPSLRKKICPPYLSKPPLKICSKAPITIATINQGDRLMGFNSSDTTALNAATDAGMKCFTLGMVGDSQRQEALNKIECPCQGNSEDNPKKLLAGAIEAYTRIYPEDTLWVEVNCDKIPSYVMDAVVDLQSFGCRMIVSHGAKSSHGKGPSLSASLCEAVKAANRGGKIWHPLEEVFMSAT
jgi:hypothetical protein